MSRQTPHTAKANAADTQRVCELLQAYGRNPLRWPDADRARFAHLVRNPAALPEVEAREAAELDMLLDAADARTVLPGEGARQRLLAAVSHEPQKVAFGTRPPLTAGRGLFAGALLAASLAIGVFAGLATEVGPTLAGSIQLETAATDFLGLDLSDAGTDGDLL